jgi:CRP/FNR family cyclic AMP-dependent transcriptional regulator
MRRSVAIALSGSVKPVRLARRWCCELSYGLWFKIEQNFTVRVNTFVEAQISFAHSRRCDYRRAPMKSHPSGASHFNVQDLARAIARNQSYDALDLALTATEWDVLGGYLQPFALALDQVLIEQGAMDRTLYFLEQGTLSLHNVGEDGYTNIAMVTAGSVVGEWAFFSSMARKSDAVGTGPCKLWRLSLVRFMDLANRHPALALRVALAAGTVMAKRVVNKPRSIAAT